MDQQMNQKMWILTAAAMASLTSLAHPARAATITVGDLAPQSFPGAITPPSTASHENDGLGYPGDSVGMTGGTFSSLVLADGWSGDLKINTLNWTVSYTYAGAGDPADPDAGWQELSFDIDAARTLTIDSQTVTLTQHGLLNVNYDNDYLSFDDGPTASLFADGYKIDITPLGLDKIGATNFDGDAPWSQPSADMYAHFSVTSAPVPVPEPGSAGLLLLGGVAVVAMSRRVRRPAV
jgi:hypothetical protein